MKPDKKENMPKVSIVVPVYNAEKYLTKTLACIINQTMEDMEIICVDDASTDDSLSILEQFANKDHRICIIKHCENRGAASSRNIGLEKAKGAYICFLDADDIFSKDMIEKEYNVMCRYDADIAVVRTAYFRENITTMDIREPFWKEQIVSMENADHNLLRDWELPPWNKMYKKEFLEKHHLLFQELSSSNDVFLGIMSVFLANKIALVESDGPMVFYRTGTKTQISARRVPVNAYYAFEKVHEEMVKQSLWNKYCEDFWDYFLVCILFEIRSSKDEQAKRQLYEFVARDGLQRMGVLEISEDDFTNRRVYQGIRSFLYESYDSGWFYKW